MFDTTHFVAFLLAGISLNLVPGPDTMYVLARSLAQGRRAGVLATLGICSGAFLHITAAVFGFSAVLMTSATAFNVVKYAGAAYLAYFGIQMLRSKSADIEAPTLAAETSARIWAQGALTTVLNPKVALFFLAFLPQFVDPKRSHVSSQFFLLGMTFWTTGTVWLLIVAATSGSLGSWLARRPVVARVQQKATGALFLFFGARLALARQR
jgi:threonine/homoserine/homoserine lactone efflux protein